MTDAELDQVEQAMDALHDLGGELERVKLENQRLREALDAALPILAGIHWSNPRHNLLTIAKDALKESPR